MESNLLRRGLSYLGLCRDARRLRRAKDGPARQRAQLALAERMGRLRGIPQKLGQILSMGQDAEAFAPLTHAAEPLPLVEIEAGLRAAWQRDTAEVYTRISPRGLAASLGQVHRATLQDGREVAIKLRYPGIARAMTWDLKALTGVSSAAGVLRRGFDLGAYRREIRRDLEEELDYRREADNQARMARCLNRRPGWCVPALVEELCAEEVLVSTWEAGDELGTVVRTWSAAERQRLAEVLLDGFLAALFDEGLLHADPHDGNYRFRIGAQGPEVVLYDFGCVCRIEPVERVLLLTLLREAGRPDARPMDLLVDLGFDAALLAPLRPQLPALLRVLFAPFLDAAPQRIHHAARRAAVQELLGERAWNFRMSGPADLLFLVRAFHGLLHQLEVLGAAVDGRAALAPYLERHRRELDGVDCFRGPTPAEPAPIPCLAERLLLRITRDGRSVLELTFPATHLDALEEEMDAEFLDTLTARDIDLGRLVSEARARDYAPGTLFELSEQPPQAGVRLWLE